jgi:hypothetical protein
MHLKYSFNLLSRIDGDAPRASESGGGVLDSPRAGQSSTSEAALFLSIRTKSLRCRTVHRSQLQFEASLNTPLEEKEQLHVYETLRRKSLVPDFER